MKSRLEPLEVNRENPFLHCKLDRQKYAEVLTQVVDTYTQGCVLAINGEWGSGKTTFMSMWKQMLKNRGFTALYFNVWEHDFVSDPLIGLVAELKSQLKVKDSTNQIEKIIEASEKILRGALPSLLGHFAEKIVGKGFAEVAKDTFSSTIHLFAKEVEIYEEQCSSISEFKQTLSELVEFCSNGKPLIFIVDELDRCNPFYAVKVLERIKHLFMIPNVVFVLSIDKKQLCSSIKGYYGSESINADEYLKRFIDIEYLLPQPDVEKFVEYLYEVYDFGVFFNHPERMKSARVNRERECFEKMSKYLFTDLHMNLRQMERAYSHIRLVIETFGTNSYINPEIILILYYIRMRDCDSYTKIKNKQLTIENLVSLIENLLPNSFFASENSSSDYKVRFVTYSVGLFLSCYTLNRNGYPIYTLLNKTKDALLFNCKVIDVKMLLEAIKFYERQGFDSCVFDLSLLIEHIELLFLLRAD